MLLPPNKVDTTMYAPEEVQRGFVLELELPSYSLEGLVSVASSPHPDRYGSSAISLSSNFTLGVYF